MSWILGACYCGIIWLVFAKLKLIRLTLPLAILLASVGPSLIVALLLCAQYLHPYTPTAIVLERIDPITPQLSRSGRVLKIMARPNEPIREGDTLFTVDPVPYENAVRHSETGLEQAKQNVNLANSSVALAEAVAERAEADLTYAKNDRDRQQELRESGGASQDELERSVTQFRQAVAAMTQAEESLTQAKLSVEVAKSKVTEASVALENAQYDLVQTKVLAPADGYVTNMQLREGMMVGGGGNSAVMTFVREPEQEERGVIVATFAEKNYLRIKPDQYAEVALDGYPGQILTGRVLNVIDASGTGQLTASGTLPAAIVSGQPTLYAVRIRLDEGRTLRLPGGAQGMVAVYTEDLQIAGVPVMFLIRTHSWLNYLK